MFKDLLPIYAMNILNNNTVSNQIDIQRKSRDNSTVSIVHVPNMSSWFHDILQLRCWKFIRISHQMLSRELIHPLVSGRIAMNLVVNRVWCHRRMTRSRVY